MHKTLTMKTIPRLWNEVGTVISEEHAKMNLHVTTPIDSIMHEVWDEEITQLHKAEHIRLQEAIR